MPFDRKPSAPLEQDLLSLLETFTDGSRQLAASGDFSSQAAEVRAKVGASASTPADVEAARRLDYAIAAAFEVCSRLLDLSWPASGEPSIHRSGAAGGDFGAGGPQNVSAAASPPSHDEMVGKAFEWIKWCKPKYGVPEAHPVACSAAAAVCAAPHDVEAALQIALADEYEVFGDCLDEDEIRGLIFSIHPGDKAADPPLPARPVAEPPRDTAGDRSTIDLDPDDARASIAAEPSARVPGQEHRAQIDLPTSEHGDREPRRTLDALTIEAARGLSETGAERSTFVDLYLAESVGGVVGAPEDVEAAVQTVRSDVGPVVVDPPLTAIAERGTHQIHGDPSRASMGNERTGGAYVLTPAGDWVRWPYPAKQATKAAPTSSTPESQPRIQTLIDDLHNRDWGAEGVTRANARLDAESYIRRLRDWTILREITLAAGIAAAIGDSGRVPLPLELRHRIEDRIRDQTLRDAEQDVFRDQLVATIVWSDLELQGVRLSAPGLAPVSVRSGSPLLEEARDLVTQQGMFWSLTPPEVGNAIGAAIAVVLRLGEALLRPEVSAATVVGLVQTRSGRPHGHESAETAELALLLLQRARALSSAIRNEIRPTARGGEGA
jgi:hypothetical protein